MSAYLVFLLAGIAGGLVNVVAGGAKLFVFPILLAAGLSPLAANATGTVGLWPAQLPGVWMLRRSLPENRVLLVVDGAIACAGAVIGAVLLFILGEGVFLYLVPAFLVIAVTAILFGDQVARLGLRLAGRSGAAARVLFFVAGVYAGYFGAGLGFMVLAAVLLSGEGSIHAANARKNLLTFGANSAAVIPLSLTGLVAWDAALAVLLGGLIGGVAGGWVSGRLPARPLKWVIAVMGTVLTLSFLFG